MTLPDPKKQAFDLFSRFSVLEEMPGVGITVNVNKSKEKADYEVQRVVAALGNQEGNVHLIHYWVEVRLEIAMIK
jgi:hypothetical protein